MRIKEISTSKDGQKWQDYVFNHPQGTVYHTLEWRDILYNEYKYKPIYLIAEEKEKTVGVFPLFFIKNFTGRKLVSLPFSQLGGPLVDNIDVWKALILKSKVFFKNLKCKSFTIKSNKLDDHKIIRKLGFIEKNNFINSSLLLKKNFNDLENNFSRNKKRKVKDCIDAGFTTRFADGLSDVKALYALELELRKRQGSPIPSWNYFKSQWEFLFKKGLLKIIIAKFESKVVAGEIFFSFNNCLMNIYSISNDKYKNLSPITLIQWEEIRWAVENNYKYVDFGITDKNFEGILEFKTKWGTDNMELPYLYYPSLPKIDSAKKEGIIYEIFKYFCTKLPLPVIKFLGPFIIKNFG